MLAKAEVRQAVRDLLDDPTGERWPDARLDVLVTVTLDDLWGQLLSAAPNYRSTLETLSGSPKLVSPGVIVLAELSERYHKPQKVTRGKWEYGPVDPREVVIEDSEIVSGPRYTYFRMGGSLWLLPLDDSTDVELRYSSRPTAFRDLSDDADVEWPDGFEAAYLHECAGRPMLKGGAEDPSGNLAIAQRAMQRMMAAIEREHPGPSVIFASNEEHRGLY